MLSHFSTSWNLLVGFWVVCKNLSNQVIIVKFVYREEESQSEETYLLNGLFVICKWNSKSLRPYCSRPIIKQCWSHFVLSLWSCGVYSQLSLRGTTLRRARSALLRARLHGVGGPPAQVGYKTVADPGEGPGFPPFISIFLDQTKARMAAKNFLETASPHQSQALDVRRFPPPPPPPLSLIWRSGSGTEKIIRVYVQSYNRAIPGFTFSWLLNGC